MSNIIIHFQYKRYYLQCSAVCTAITDPLSTLKIIAIYSVQFILYILSALERLVCTVLSALKRIEIEISLTFFLLHNVHTSSALTSHKIGLHCYTVLSALKRREIGLGQLQFAQHTAGYQEESFIHID